MDWPSWTNWTPLAVVTDGTGAVLTMFGAAIAALFAAWQRSQANDRATLLKDRDEWRAEAKRLQTIIDERNAKDAQIAAERDKELDEATKQRNEAMLVIARLEAELARRRQARA